MNPIQAKRLNLKLSEAPKDSLENGQCESKHYTVNGEVIKRFTHKHGQPITVDTVISGLRNKITFINIGTVNAEWGNFPILALGGQLVLDSSNNIDLNDEDILIRFIPDPDGAGEQIQDIRYFETILDDFNVLNYHR